jgi:hypothetical protein
LTWTPAEDDDVVRYELRRGTPADTWETAGSIATIDALNYFDSLALSGLVKYFIKAIDRSGQLTIDALSVEIDVTLNPDLGFSSKMDVDLTQSTVENVLVYPGGTVNDIALPVDDITKTWSQRFDGGPVWSDTPGLRWLIPATDPDPIWLETDQIDMGSILTGDVKLTYLDELIGDGTGASLLVELMVSEDGTNWTNYPAGVPVTVTGRYFKVRADWGGQTADSYYLMKEPGSIYFAAVPVIDYGTVDVDASGVLPVAFAVVFKAIDRIKVTPMGSDPKIALPDNLTLTGFDLNLFDNDGNPAAGRVNWEAKGV